MSLLGLASASAESTTFAAVMDHVSQGFEALGATVLVLGTLWSFALAAITLRRAGAGRGYRAYSAVRQALGGALMLGLEILVAADLIRTVAVAPTLTNVLVLGLIVLIRTFLSFSLETEIEGVAPWRRAAASGAGAIKRASSTALRSDSSPLAEPASAAPRTGRTREPMPRCCRSPARSSPGRMPPSRLGVAAC